MLIDKAILKDCKRRHTNLAMAWIDYRKACDVVPHSWIGECLEMFGIAVYVRQFLLSSMKEWKTELTSCGQQLGVVDIKRGIFQGDSLSPLLLVLCKVPLSLVLRRSKAGYEWGGHEFQINHLLFMDDLKLFWKSYEHIDSLVQTVHTFSKEYKRRLKLVLKSKLSGKNKIMAANTWAVAILRYSAGLVGWKTNELKVLDRKTRKMMSPYAHCTPKVM